MRRTSLGLCGVSTLLVFMLSVPAWAQHEGGYTAADLSGSWDGFRSDGGVVTLHVLWDPDAGADAIELRAFVHGRPHLPLTGRYTYRAGSGSAGYLLPVQADGPLALTWLNAGAVRLSHPWHEQTLLGRTGPVPDNPFSPGFEEAGFHDHIRARLLFLDGDWRARLGDTAGDSRVALRVVDPAAGLLEWAGEVDPLGRPLDGALDLRLLRVDGTNLRVRFDRDGDEHEVLLEQRGGRWQVRAGDALGVALTR